MPRIEFFVALLVVALVVVVLKFRASGRSLRDVASGLRVGFVPARVAVGGQTFEHEPAAGTMTPERDAMKPVRARRAASRSRTARPAPLLLPRRTPRPHGTNVFDAVRYRQTLDRVEALVILGRIDDAFAVLSTTTRIFDRIEAASASCAASDKILGRQQARVSSLVGRMMAAREANQAAAQ